MNDKAFSVHTESSRSNKTSLHRRYFLKLAGPAALMMACPAYAFDLFKVIDPEGKNKDLQKAKTIVQGVGSIASSATKMDYKSELTIGESLALEGFKRYGLPVQNQNLQRYVNLVGNAVARNSERPEIPYYFVVVKSNLYNAFACPGGIIFVSSTLVQNMKDESQLACVLAHEVGHVSHKHALKSIRRAQFFEGVSKISTVTMKGKDGKKFRNMIGDLQSVLFDRGLDKNMEFEADLAGMEIAYRTGYNPLGLIRVLQMLRTKEQNASKKGSWFSTHPPLPERIKRCRAKKEAYPDAASLASVQGRFLNYRKMLF